MGVRARGRDGADTVSAGSSRAPRIAAVLLAAGEARRMQGIDKRLLAIDGEPLVRRWLRLLREAGVGDVVLVTGDRAERLAPHLHGAQARVVHHADWAQGQQSSVLVGLGALAPGFDAAMIALCDLPLLEAADLARLIDAFVHRPAGIGIQVPVHDGQRGHPVIVSAEVVARVLADPVRAGLRAFIDGHRALVRRVEAGSDHVCFDLDTPGDIARLEERVGRPVGRQWSG